MTAFVWIDAATGDIAGGGDVPDRDIGGQLPPVEGASMVKLPPGVLAWPNLNLDVFKDHLCQQVDAAAEAVRAPYITAGDGQLLTYVLKAQEAQAFAANASAPTPIIAAEAAALGQTVAAQVAAVLASVALAVQVAAVVEPARQAAKKAIEAATTVGAIAAAGNVDWAALAATLATAVGAGNGN